MQSMSIICEMLKGLNVPSLIRCKLWQTYTSEAKHNVWYEVWVAVAKMWGVCHFAWESSIQSISPIPTLDTALTHMVEPWNSPVSHTGHMQSNFLWDLSVPIFSTCKMAAVYVSKQDQFKTKRTVNVRCEAQYEVWVVTCKMCVLDVRCEIQIGWLSVNLRLGQSVNQHSNMTSVKQ